jgi:aryl-alcohol dehydrogenase-like predicted oxidoreductase
VAQQYHLVGPTVEQPQYNLFERDRVEMEYRPLYKSPGIGLTTWSPLSSGILSGKYSGKALPEGSRLAIELNSALARVGSFDLAHREAERRLERAGATIRAALGETGAEPEDAPAHSTQQEP